MRLTVLGKSPSWQDAGGACSGYLLQDGETNILLDCGNVALLQPALADGHPGIGRQIGIGGLAQP